MSTPRRRGVSPLLVPTLAAAVVIVLTLSLGAWQLRRADEKRVLQAAREAASQATPTQVGVSTVRPQDIEGRPVVAQGRWLNERSVFLDNRTHQGRAGFHVLTPLRLEASGAGAQGAARTGNGTGTEAGSGAVIEAAAADRAAPMHLLVLRGWVPRDPRERTRLPELPEGTDMVRIEGIAQASLPGAMALSAAAGEGEGGRIWQRVNLPAYAAWSGLVMQPVIVRQTGGDEDALVREWAAPGAGVDKHLGYAVQWFAMAAATLALWGWFGLRPALARRGMRDNGAAGAAGVDGTNGSNDG